MTILVYFATDHPSRLLPEYRAKHGDAYCYRYPEVRQWNGVPWSIRSQVEWTRNCVIAHREDPENEFRIVTASEYVILALLHSIRRGDIGASDVVIYHVDETVTRLRIGSAGEIIDWVPGGVFPQRVDLLFD